MIQAKYIETYNGFDYYRDKFGNIYVKLKDDICYCSNLKQGRLNDDKAEPSYPMYDVELVR